MEGKIREGKKTLQKQAASRPRLAIRPGLVPKAAMRLSLHRNPVAPAMKVRSHSSWRLMVHPLHTSPGYRFCSTLQGSTCLSRRIQLNTAKTSFGCLSTYPSTGWSQEDVLLWLVFATNRLCDPVQVTLALWNSVFSPVKGVIGSRPAQQFLWP